MVYVDCLKLNKSERKKKATFHDLGLDIGEKSPLIFNPLNFLILLALISYCQT